MPVIDRRIVKSRESIKSAFIELMSQKHFNEITIQDISNRANVGRRTIYHHYLDKFDLLDKLIEEHINELRTICESTSDLDFVSTNVMIFEHFDRNQTFFSTMLASNGVTTFRSRLLAFLIEQLQHEVDITQGINKGLNKGIILTFLGTAIAGIIESYMRNEMTESPKVVAEHVGMLLERNLFMTY
ncbi:TetR/AcrR family transcriptional regulator [Paenibacillus qinlingensis]|uniref:AcrR family transcriptional regulator n=1 Tax=Paenibacillus qinlingensis TaxID=1837343 RepID=A0ABU1NS04_9BACL|nr:TetR/AcrR family transcriptional regulator [Paenibacillus qinlingensis]MDR6550260.1 AcrR family transcriptional regulator [Paenibacillus qinlingensis]